MKALMDYELWAGHLDDRLYPPQDFDLETTPIDQEKTLWQFAPHEFKDFPVDIFNVEEIQNFKENDIRPTTYCGLQTPSTLWLFPMNTWKKELIHIFSTPKTLLEGLEDLELNPEHQEEFQHFFQTLSGKKALLPLMDIQT